MEVGHGGIVPAGRLIAPRVEAEIMLVLDRDLSHPGVTFTDVIQASAFAMASLEIVDSRVMNWDITIADTIADNGSAGMYVVGSVPQAVLNADMANCTLVR